MQKCSLSNYQVEIDKNATGNCYKKMMVGNMNIKQIKTLERIRFNVWKSTKEGFK